MCFLGHILRKNGIAPPKQMLLLTIFNGNIFFKTKDTRLGANCTRIDLDRYSYIKKKSLQPLFMDVYQLSQGYRVTTRRQFSLLKWPSG